MGNLKFLLTKEKKHKFKKLYSLKLTSQKRSTKSKYLGNLGIYVPKLRFHMFMYSTIIPTLKLGYNFSKQSSVTSLYYLKKVLKRNL